LEGAIAEGCSQIRGQKVSNLKGGNVSSCRYWLVFFIPACARGVDGAFMLFYHFSESKEKRRLLPARTCFGGRACPRL